MAGVSTRQRLARRGTERGRGIVHELTRQAEIARVEHGTSYAELGRALRLGGGQVARICRGQSPDLTIVRAARLLAVVRLDLSARAFPSGPSVRDAGQVRLLNRLRARLHASLGWRTEVPVLDLPDAGSIDRRAWDAMIEGPGWLVPVDAETRIGDLQAVQRRVALKQRDSGAESLILLLAETRHHRAVLGLAGDGFRGQFPVAPRA